MDLFIQFYLLLAFLSPSYFLYVYILAYTSFWWHNLLRILFRCKGCLFPLVMWGIVVSASERRRTWQNLFSPLSRRRFRGNSFHISPMTRTGNHILILYNIKNGKEPLYADVLSEKWWSAQLGGYRSSHRMGFDQIDAEWNLSASFTNHRFVKRRWAFSQLKFRLSSDDKWREKPLFQNNCPI